MTNVYFQSQNALKNSAMMPIGRTGGSHDFTGFSGADLILGRALDVDFHPHKSYGREHGPHAGGAL